MSSRSAVRNRASRGAGALPKRRRTQAERSEAMRKRLLDAAVKVIMSRGYLGFTTIEAAKIAGVTRGAAHHHFRNADAFLLAALEHMFARAQRNSRMTIAHLSETDDVLHALAADARKFYFSEAFFGGLDALLSATKDASTRAGVRDLGNRYRTGNEEMWRDHLIAQGVPARDAETAVWMLLSIIRGFAIRSLLKHDPMRIDEMIALGLSMMQRFLREQQLKTQELEAALRRAR